MKLPQITADQVWCCEMGCGGCTPKEIDRMYSETRDPNGRLVQRLTEKDWVSNCCNANLFLWDNSVGDEVPWEPVE